MADSELTRAVSAFKADLARARADIPAYQRVPAPSFGTVRQVVDLLERLSAKVDKLDQILAAGLDRP